MDLVDIAFVGDSTAVAVAGSHHRLVEGGRSIVGSTWRMSEVAQRSLGYGMRARHGDG